MFNFHQFDQNQPYRLGITSGTSFRFAPVRCGLQQIKSQIWHPENHDDVLGRNAKTACDSLAWQVNLLQTNLDKMAILFQNWHDQVLRTLTSDTRHTAAFGKHW